MGPPPSTFGDGAGAAVLEAGRESEPGALLGFDLGSDGLHREVARVPGGGSLPLADPAAGFQQSDHSLAMRGKEIFTHTVGRMSGSSGRLLKQVGWEAGTWTGSPAWALAAVGDRTSCRPHCGTRRIHTAGPLRRLTAAD
ncbi:hypothetical protein FRZ03_08835 [Streptomyces misionensis]|uniref:Uncharacterized protein n=1 Tax=Streptomyces misionensis TaxID=67331 RepID=A0A5C6JY72_9ACTN|nr:hypothetical protein FRZ03_08835 [Streptomyces misionensis]